MATVEKRSVETTATHDDRDHHDRDSHHDNHQRDHHDRDSHRERGIHHDRDSHQQRAGLATAENAMATWTGAIYDYADQVLGAQRQFAESMLAASAPMLNVARDITPPLADEHTSANQMDARSDRRHDGSHTENLDAASAANRKRDPLASSPSN